ncbi:MAG TPA: uroporphyrinogen decarboxylase family protein [Candidatus Nitrosotenuis sp.]|nr:uroporphyrinogen decarboxylase family protein [Candidatus Nitrosotenuis sp.]
MDRIERLQAVLAGEAVDRPPFTFWHHFGLQHMPGDALASAEVAFARRYQPDLLKVMSDYPYPLPERLSLDRPQDLTRLDVLRGKEGDWEQQLLALRKIAAAARGKLWVLETVFSPWTVLRRLAGQALVARCMAEHPGFLRHALEAISQSLVNYLRHCQEAGVDGIYYAVSGASHDHLTPEDYARWARPYDLRVLEAASSFKMRVLHLHGRRLHFEAMLDYPAEVLSWSTAAGPGLARGAARWGKVVMAGLDEEQIPHMTPTAVAAHVRAVAAEMPHSGFILAPGCSLAPDTSPRLLEALRDAALALPPARPRPAPGQTPAAAPEPATPPEPPRHKGERARAGPSRRGPGKPGRGPRRGDS